MEIELNRIFVKVVQSGSFTNAAKILKLPKSSVSRAVAKLELSTKTKLLMRTTRNLNLTQAGKEFFEACAPAIVILEEAQKRLEDKEKNIAGLIRITAPEDLGMSVVAPTIAKLSLKYPDLNFEFNFTDAVVDIVKDGYDIAVRIGIRVDSGLKLTQAGEVTLIAVASPKYLAKKDKIIHPNDLKILDCLSHNWSKQWILKSSKATVKIPVKAVIVGNQMITLLDMAISGCGVALAPKHLCEPYLKSGKLVHVLPDWKSQPIPASIITPVAPSSSMRLKTAVTAIADALKKALE